MTKFLGWMVGLFTLAFVLLPINAEAACGAGSGTCFVVAGGGNSNSTATWSASSGGATCTCTPASSDAVILDSAAGNLTINAALSIQSLDASGTGGSGSPYTGTLTHNSAQTLTINGTLFKLVSGMTYTLGNTSTSSITFADTTASDVVNITWGTKNTGAITFGTASSTSVTWRLVDTPSSTGGAWTLTAGTLDASTNNVSPTILSLSISGSNTRTFNGGTGTWTTKATSGTVVDCSTITNLTVSAASTNWTITVSNPNMTISLCNSSSAFSLGNFTLQNTGTGAGAIASNLSGHMHNLTLNGLVYFTQGGGTTLTIDNALSIAGTTSLPVEMATSSGGGTPATVSIATGATANWVIFRGITFSTSAMTATNCFNMGGNNFNGGGCTGPLVGGGGIIGGGG